MSDGSGPKDETAELKALLDQMINVTSKDAASLTRTFATMAGDVSPIVLWSAATTMALMAMRSMEDSSPKDDGGLWCLADSLDGARASIPRDLFRLDRTPGDDPVIVEVWL